jgi:NitT/TauT family transport system substrate-binding protein
MNKKIIVGIILTIAVVGGVSYYHLNQKSKTDLPIFTLSVNTWVGFGPFYLAQEKGFFADERVEVDIRTIEDVAQKKSAIKQGRVDGLGDTIDSFVLAVDEDVPVTAVAQLDISNGADGILTIEGINTIRDLKGKKIAAQKNFVSEAFLNYLLIANGMSPSDVQVIDTEAGAAGAAFVSGNVDVAVTFEPWLSKAQERSGGKLLVSSKQHPDILVDLLLINDDYLKNNRETVEKVLRAWFRAIEFWENNPVEANTIMAKHYNETPEVFAELLDGVEWPTYENNLQYFASRKAVDVANTFSQVFLKTGQIKSAPDMARLITSDILDKLYEQK